MSIFSDLTPEQKELVKNCKSKEELDTLLKGFTALAEEELAEVTGGDSEIVIKHGDTCKNVKTENVSSDFATGEITGADFFA